MYAGGRACVIPARMDPDATNHWSTAEEAAPTRKIRTQDSIYDEAS